MPELVARREDVWHEAILQDRVESHHAGDGGIEGDQGHELPNPEDQDGGQPGKMRGRIVSLVGAENEVGVHGHDYGQAIDNHVHDEDGGKACSQEFGLVGPALIPSWVLDRPRVDVDEGLMIYMWRRLWLWNRRYSPVPAWTRLSVQFFVEII